MFNTVAIELLSEQLKQAGLDAYFLPPEDEHLNEYLPENKKRIQWLTGFSGESAPALVTLNRAHVYVDGRFHIQVDSEIDPKWVESHKLLPDQSWADQIIETLVKTGGTQVGYDPFMVTPSRLKALEDAAKKRDVSIDWIAFETNLVDKIWVNRPPMPSDPAFILDDTITGESVYSKLKRVREILAEKRVDILPLTKLDQIAWLLNIRGRDIPNNPVFESYALLTQSTVIWFAPLNKVPQTVKQKLTELGITLMPYHAYTQGLKTLLSSHSNKPLVWIDNNYTTLGTCQLVDQHALKYVAVNPIAVLKDIKNDTEIERMKLANQRASRAIIRHLTWAHQGFERAEVLSEQTLRQDIESKYKEEEEFFDLSFPTIPGVGSNSAIIHYSHADPNKLAKNGEWYLLDSGCHYLGGTTDTTRTTVFGTPTKEQIEKYTAVLKAHIACANLVFPAGTTGMQIDAVCRAPLWALGLDFGHGTGHGVGPFLDVHAGRHRISKMSNTPFEPGMVTSIEPGYYQEGWGGIRLENLYTVVKTEQPSYFGKPFYTFKPFTLVPFEKKLINLSQLTKAEISWLMTYYEQIEKTISPTLGDVERKWLQDQIALI